MAENKKETNKELENQPEVENQTEQSQQETLADLSIKDLMALRSIIDLASQRGAFKPTEMVSVGQNYNKLNEFLEIVIAQQQREQQSK